MTDPSIKSTEPVRRQGLVAAAATVALMLPASLLAQQPCNPVIDGTYCSSLPSTAKTYDLSTPVTISPVRDLGSAISSRGDSDPGTFAGISFRGGTTCIGLLRRGKCY